MIKFSSSFKLNEIHIVDSPFNEDPKNIIFFREALISGEGRQENLGELAILLLCKLEGGEISKKNITPYPLVPKSFDTLIFLHARQNFRKKNKTSIFRPKFNRSLGSSPPKI